LRQQNLAEEAVVVAQEQVGATSTSSANLIATQNAELEQIKVTGTASARETSAAAQATEELLIATVTADAAIRMANDATATVEAATRVANDANATVEAATRIANDARATVSANELLAAQAEVRRLALARPLLPGVSISAESGETGSLTAFVKDENGDVYLLSVIPVLGGPNPASGAPILQPGLNDNGNILSDTVATLIQIPDLAQSSVAGLALLQDGLSFSPSVPGLGPIRGVRPPADKMNIVVFGRGSAPVLGYLVENISLQQTVQQDRMTTYSIILDSDYSGTLSPGALVLDRNGYAVGLVAGQNEETPIVLPLQPILDDFQVTLIYVGEQLYNLPAQLAVNSVAYSSAGILAAGGDDFRIRLWKGDDLTDRNQEPLEILSGHNNHVLTLDFSPDGSLLASGGRDNRIIIWSTGAVGEEAIERLHVLSEHFNVVQSLAFSPDGRQLASTGADNRILLWDATDFASKPTQLSSRSDREGHLGNVTDLAYHPQLPMLASSGEDETVRFWYLGDDDAFPRVSVLKTDHRDDVNAVAFSPDGQFMATASSDRTVRLWDMSEFLQDPTQDPILQASLTNHGSLVLDVEFSPNGATLASASLDSLVRLWDVRNLNIPPIVMSGHRDFVYTLSYGPEGQGLASGGSDARVRIWEVQTLFEPE
jgi:WD40 repeat protein